MGLLHFDYLSAVLGYHTSIYYILPPCIHEGREPKATLYLLHGGGGNSMDWIRYTAIERYAEQHEIAIVMPEVDGSCFYADMKYGYPYFTFLTQEVIAVSETMLPINRDAEKRLLAGLSMGGYGAFKWAFYAPDQFKAAANLSGISFITEIFNGPKAFAIDEDEKKKILTLNWGSLEELSGSISDSKLWIDEAVKNDTKLPRLFAGIGTEDFSYQHAQDYLNYCNDQGIVVHYEEIPGGHEWAVWDTLIQYFLEWIEF